MTQKRFKIKKGDTVQVVTGARKGMRGVVEKVLLDDAKVVVKDVNVVKRNVKISEMHPEGYVTKTLPMPISNVSLIDPATDKPAKVGYRFAADGTKERYFKKSNNVVVVS